MRKEKHMRKNEGNGCGECKERKRKMRVWNDSSTVLGGVRDGFELEGSWDLRGVRIWMNGWMGFSFEV